MNKKYILILLILIFALFIYTTSSEPIDFGKTTVIDEPSVVGFWKNTLSTGSSAKFTFNQDMTGDIYLDGVVYGDFYLDQKTYFRYNLNKDYIYLNNIHPKLMGGGSDTKLKYEFISRNRLLIGNTVFEKQLW